MTYNKYNSSLSHQDSSEDDSYWYDTSFSRNRNHQQSSKSEVSKPTVATNQANSKIQSAQNLEQTRNQLLGGDGIRSHYKNVNSTNSSYNGRSEQQPSSAQKMEQLQKQITASQQRSVASSERTLQLIQDSESIGIETANELTRQGEQLQRAENGLDEINRELNTSKRYITSMKSWFGPVKNYFSSSSANEAPRRDSVQSKNQTFSSQSAASSSSTTAVAPQSSRDARDFSLFSEGQMAGWSNEMKENEKRCNQNLASMSSGLDQLKRLASGLGDELDKQNESLDRMNYKAEGNTIKMKKQNADLKDMLK